MADPFGAIEFSINRIKEITWYVKGVREYSSDLEAAERTCSDLSDKLYLAKRILENDQERAEPIFAQSIQDLESQGKKLRGLVEELKPPSDSRAPSPSRKSWHKRLVSKFSKSQQPPETWNKYTHPIMSKPQLENITAICQKYKSCLFELVQLYNA